MTFISIVGPSLQNFLKLKGKAKFASPFTACITLICILVLITALLSYGQGIGSIVYTQTQTISSGVVPVFKFVEDLNVNSSNIHLLPNISVVTKASSNISNYPIVPYNDFKSCGCACMLEQGSYKI